MIGTNIYATTVVEKKTTIEQIIEELLILQAQYESKTIKLTNSTVLNFEINEYEE